MQEVLSVKCKEPSGEVERKIYLMDYTKINLFKLWSKARQFPVLFGHKLSDNFIDFCGLFLVEMKDGLMPQGMIWVVDDFTGIFYLTDAKHPYDALVHYSFFDRRHKGRVELTRTMLDYVFKEYGYNRLSAELPRYVTRHAFDFVESVGFKPEGTKRRAAEWNGNIVDVRCYGILPADLDISSESEVLNGSEN